MNQKVDKNFENCTFLEVGDKVKLSARASDWKYGNTNTPLHIFEGLSREKEYTIKNTTPIMKVVGGDQQFVDLADDGCTYACWCFDKI